MPNILVDVVKDLQFTDKNTKQVVKYSRLVYVRRFEKGGDSQLIVDKVASDCDIQPGLKTGNIIKIYKDEFGKVVKIFT